ncbi:hypothetical protein ABTX77_19475 [Streptomyces sp. NPDC097704]|uniref:hypothetical protein n=1 Tax=Streptomyces sp. NPDC097704 TaxID=3157101 RepID=UPI00332E7F34
MYGGLALCTVLAFFSPTVSGTAYALWPDVAFDWYPFHSPGLVSVPAAFLLGRLGSAKSSADAGSRSPRARAPV